MTRTYRRRIVTTVFVLLFSSVGLLHFQGAFIDVVPPAANTNDEVRQTYQTLNLLAVKGRAPKTGYTREQFGDGWRMMRGCSIRNIILNRDLVDAIIDAECNVTMGTLQDPYTSKVLQFQRGQSTSSAVQIDHVVALSNAWQTGAQQLTSSRREDFANDPLNLLAVAGSANQQKGDGDAATWLPPNKSFRCQYVTRQVDVKAKYELWVTSAERAAIMRVLSSC